MSDFQYVNVGPSANDGLGDSLRDAFLKVNLNFAELSSGNANVTVHAPVQSVAGRIGNIVLTTDDVFGAASIAYVNGLAFGNVTLSVNEILGAASIDYVNQVAMGNVSINAPVRSVNGQTGNVHLSAANFTDVASISYVNNAIANVNVVAGASTVQTVAGRTGNIVLTTNDVSGAASIAYVNSLLQGSGGLQGVIDSFANLQANVGNLQTTVSTIDTAQFANITQLFANTVQQEAEIKAAFANIITVQSNISNIIANLNFTQLVNGNATLTLSSNGTVTAGNVRTNGIYTDHYFYANGNPFVSTTVANTAEIVANISGGYDLGLTLTNTGVSAGTYGSSSSVPTFNVDNHGRVTFAANVPVAGVSNVTYNSVTGNLTVSTSAGTNFVVDLGSGSGDSPTFANLAVTNNFQLPVGNTASRPTAASGEFRFNTDLQNVEFYNGTAWVPIVGSLTSQAFIGDSINATYTLDHTAAADGLLVSINGTVQEPNLAYSVTGTLITFAEVLTPMDTVNIRFLSSLTSIVANSATMPYTMGNYRNWTSNVTTVSSALDQIAARLKAAGF